MIRLAFFDQTVLDRLVVVEQRASWRLRRSHSHAQRWLGVGTHVRIENLGVVEDSLHSLEAEEDLDQPGVVEVERRVDGPVPQLAELAELLVCPRSDTCVDHVEAGQRPHPVHPVRVAAGEQVRELQECPRLGPLGDDSA